MDRAIFFCKLFEVLLLVGGRYASKSADGFLFKFEMLLLLLTLVARFWMFALRFTSTVSKLSFDTSSITGFRWSNLGGDL